jgi:pseudouridine synthase
MALERLQKILAHAGVASRRVSEEIIADRRVTIDGKVVTEPGTKADPAVQDVRLDGRRIRPERPEYWLLNKPKGVVCTNLDPAGRPRPIDLMAPYTRARLFPVGRLDVDSKGLLIMTNDGEFANLLAHPRYEVPKTYVATVAGRVSGEEIRRLAGGIRLAEGRTRPARVEALKRGHTRSLLEITIREGRNRQIRRILARLRHPVRELIRTRIGRITLRGVGPGRARPLAPDEVEYLKRLAAEPRPARPAAPAAGPGKPAAAAIAVPGRGAAPRDRGRGPRARGERGHRGSDRRREGRKDRAARRPQGPSPAPSGIKQKRSRHHP